MAVKRNSGRSAMEKDWSETLIDAAPDIIVGLGEKSTILIFNKAAEKVTGYKANDVLGKKWIEVFIPGKRKKELYAVWDKIVKNKLIQHQYENPILTKKGEERLIAWNNTVISEKGKFKMVLSIGVGITAQKKAEEAVRESEKKYRFLVDNSEEFILILNSIGKIAFANRFTLETLGFKESEVIGKSVTHFLTKSSAKKALYALAQEFLGHPQPEFEIEIKAKSGEIRTLAMAKGSVFVHEKGKLIGILVSAHDVTEYKKTEEALRGSEERFRTQFDAALDAIFIADAKTGVLVDCNSAACELVERKKSEIVGKHQSILHPPEAVKGEFSKTFRQHLKEKKGRALEAQVITKKGKIKYVTIKANIFKLRGKELLQGIFRDVTAQKKAEEALRESEERYKMIVESTNDLIMLTKPDGNISYLSPACKKVLGYEPEDLLDKQPWIAHPDDLKKSKAAHFRALKGESGSNLELRILTKKGEAKWISHSWSPIMHDGKLQMIVSLVKDISEQKKTHETILRDKMFNSALIENAPFGVMTINKDGGVGYVNPAMLMISGDSKANFKEMNVFELQSYMQFGLSKKIKECFKGKSFFLGPVDYISHFSKKRTTRNFTGIPMRDEAGKIGKVMLFVEDLTKINEAEEKLRNVVEHSNEIFYIHDVHHKLTYVSPQSKLILGYSPDDMVKREWTEFTTDNPINKAGFEITEKALETGQRQEPYLLELRKKDGKKILVQIDEGPLKDNQGRVISMSGAARDVTLQKQAEEELVKRTDELEKFNKLAIGRELKMVELKKRIRELEAELGKHKNESLGRNKEVRV